MSDSVETAAKSDDTEQDLESKDGAPDSALVVKRWLKELDAADRHERDWRDRADKIVKLYRDEREKAKDGDSSRRFNILFSNTEVLKGALYSQVPTPDVRRRWLEKEPISRIAALVLMRALGVTLDQVKDGEDFDSVMKDSVSDMVLPGRAVARIKYVPQINRYEERVPVEAPAEGVALPEDVQQDEQGHFRMEKVEEVVYECVEPQYVEWSMFRYSPAKRWSKVRWIAFGELLTRDDLIAQFGEVGKKVEMKWMPKGVEDTEENAIFKRALVWSIWNKTKKRCVVVSEGYKDAPLLEVDDPLKLEGFFPIPKPLYSLCTTDSLIPTPEYAIYQDHALQLDVIEERIAILTEALKFRGVRDASIEELENLATAGDNKFVPVKNYREFVEKGGLEQAFQVLDIGELAKVILELMAQADSKKQQIYELIGISDIMRGSTKAQETLGAQKIKDQWGSIRVGPRQGEVQRFARDLIRLMAEVIAEHFSAKTLATMTGISLFETVAEKQAAAGLVQPTVPGRPAAPADPRLKRPTWEEVLQVLRSDKLRGFKVDIETDSTIKPQADDEQKNRVEGITAITGYLEKALPAVSAGMVPKKFALELLSFGIRAFKAGPQLEEMIDEWAGDALDGEQEQPQGNPMQEAQNQEMAKQAQHADSLRALEVETKKADLAKARATAYTAITEAEALVPGMQLDSLLQEANIKRAQAQAVAAEAPPAGATVQ